jgi:hypothetical protein
MFIDIVPVTGSNFGSKSTIPVDFHREKIHARTGQPEAGEPMVTLV